MTHPPASGQVIPFSGRPSADAPAGLELDKLFWPRPAVHLAPRPELVARVERGLWRPLTRIEAPAGWGKTSLLSQWMSETRWPATWLRVDADDADPRRLVAHLLAAVGRVEPEVGLSAEALMVEGCDLDYEVLLADRLVIPLEATGAQVALVLDEVQWLWGTASAPLLGWLMDHLPSGLHLLASGRAAGWSAARDQPVDIGPDELRLSVDQVAACYRRALASAPDPTWCAERRERLDGHPARLYFEICATADSTMGIREADRALLAHAAHGEWTCASELEHMTGRSDLTESLRRLADHPAVLEPLDGRGHGYRLPELARAALGLPATEPSPAARLAWRIARGYVASAVRLLEARPESSWATIDAEPLLVGLAFEGDWDRLSTLCDRCPVSLRQTAPWVWARQAAARRSVVGPGAAEAKRAWARLGPEAPMGIAASCAAGEASLADDPATAASWFARARQAAIAHPRAWGLVRAFRGGVEAVIGAGQGAEALRSDGEHALDALGLRGGAIEDALAVLEVWRAFEAGRPQAVLTALPRVLAGLDRAPWPAGRSVVLDLAVQSARALGRPAPVDDPEPHASPDATLEGWTDAAMARVRGTSLATAKVWLARRRAAEASGLPAGPNTL